MIQKAQSLLRSQQTLVDGPRGAELPFLTRALIADPTLLVCDEPTGDLDRRTADEILGLLQDLNRHHGKTIVMVTHDAKAAEYATHRLDMDKGALVTSGDSH